MVTSLNKMVSFSHVLDLLGAPPQVRTLPNSADCPLCHRRASLRVQVDPVYGGEWGWCRKCGTAGDMIEFAAAAWKLDVAYAVVKLAQAGAMPRIPDPGEVASYGREHVNRRRTLIAFYDQCQAQFAQADSSTLYYLRRKFGFDRTITEWAVAGGQVVGASSKVKVIDALGEKVRPAFRGRDWGDCLVIPFYDLPGRLSGLLCIGRQATNPEDFAFCSVLPATPRGTTEAGVGMLPAGLSAHGQTVVAMTDPSTALLFQLRNLRETGKPLPLVIGWRDGKFATRRAWENLHAAELTLWSPHGDIAPIAHAQPLDAPVSPYVATDGALANRMHWHTCTEWLDKIRATAVPWHVALRQRLRKAETNEIEAAFLELQISDRELRRFVAGCDYNLRTRLAGLLSRDKPKTVRYASKTIHERNGGWWHDEDRICNAIIRFDATAVGTDGQSYYRGTILFEGQEVPFNERSAKLETGLLSWARHYLRDVTKRGILHFHPMWDRLAYGLALTFHEPKLIASVDMLGWDAEQGSYTFPNFAIGAQGSVTYDAPCLLPAAQCPGVNLPPPGELTPAHISALGDPSTEGAVFWATTAAVLANLTAPRYGKRPEGILLVGHGAASIGEATVQQLGCIETRIRRHDDALAAALAARLGRSRWPTLVTNAGKLPLVYAGWLDDAVASRVVHGIGEPTAYTLGLRGAWTLIEAPRVLGSFQLGASAAPHVVSNYLQDTMKRTAALPHWDHGLGTLRDMADWFERVGGNPKVLRLAEKFFATAGLRPPLGHFTRLVVRLYTRGKLAFGRRDNARIAELDVYFDPKRNAIWVEQDAFARATMAESRLCPDISLITAALRQADALRDEEDNAGRRGWLVDNTWWVKQLKENDKCDAGT